MPTLEATRKPQKENISPNKELQSDTFTVLYTYRKLFGGGIDSFRDPFSGNMVQSDQQTELQFAEGAFSLPKDPGPFHKLCHNLGITPPVTKEDIPEFVKNQLFKKDSEGNLHGENPYTVVAYSHPDKEKEIIHAIQTADAPENPDSCSDMTVTINGQELVVHAHASYEGNNKSTIALFALLGHKISQAFLTKWVEKDMAKNHVKRFTGSPEKITQQIASVISERLEEEAHDHSHSPEENVENVELKQEERIDSVASITIARVISPEDKAIEESFEQVVNNKYMGQLHLNKQEPEPIQQENEALTEHFITTLKILRKETKQEEQDEPTIQKQTALLTLSLARLHSQNITMEDILADYEYPPKDEKTAAIMLAKAIEITTHPGLDQQDLPQAEKKHAETAMQLRKDYGISFINYSTSHESSYHKIVKPNSVIESCPEHAKETARLDQQLRETHNTIKEKLQQTYQPKQTLDQKPREIVRGVVQENDAAQTQLDKQTLETLSALGNTEATEKLKSVEKQEAMDKRLNAAAEIIHGDVLVRNETSQELIDTLIKEKFFGEITEEQMIRKPAKAIREANEEHTKTFEEKLTAFRQEKPIDSEKLALTLAKMHDPQIDKLSFDEKFPEYTQLTRQDVIKILALNMAIQTEPNKKDPNPQTKKIVRYARRINEEKGIHYVNLTMNHATALHLIETKKGVEPCPEHTPKVDKQLQKMQTTIKQQVNQLNQLPLRTLQLNRLQTRRVGSVAPKLDNKKEITTLSEPPLSSNRPNRQPQQRPVIPERKEKTVSFRSSTRQEARGTGKSEQLKKAHVKPKAKRPQQLTAFVQKVVGATRFVPSYFRKVDKPSDADFSFTVSAPSTKTSTGETRVVKPAVFLQPAASGRPSEGIRVVKNPRDADRVEYIATARLLKSTSAEVPSSQIKEPLSEEGKPTSVATENAAQTRENNNMRKRPAAEVIAIANVRAELKIIPESTTNYISLLSHTAEIIPFSVPTGRTTASESTQTSGGKALAAVISLAERREQRKQKTETAKQAAAETITKAPAYDLSIAVNLNETQRPVLTLIQEGDGLTEAIPAGTTTTTNPSGTTSSITVRGKARISTASPQTEKEYEAPHPSDDSPNSLNASDVEATVSNVTKKVDGAQTAKQLEKAFERKAESHIQEEVTSQLEQAASEVSETEASQTTTTETEEIEQMKSEVSVHHQQDEHAATEKVTKIKVEVAPGVYEERFVTERIEQNKTAQAEKEDEAIANDNQAPVGQATQSANAQTDQGTNEEAQQTDAQQQIAQVTPLSSRRSRRQTKATHTSSMTVQLTITSDDSLSFDQSDKWKIEQALGQIAA